jgi:hypothetical protein
MAKKGFLMGVLAGLLVVGFSGLVLGCVILPPPRMSDTNTGLLTITDIPSQYTGQDAVVYGVIEGPALDLFGGGAYLRGAAQVPSELSTGPISGEKIVNGTVAIPIFAGQTGGEGSSVIRGKWHGFVDSKTAQQVSVVITEQDSVPQNHRNTSGRYPGCFMFKDVPFTDGAATVSFVPSLPSTITPLGKEAELQGTWRDSAQRTLTFDDYTFVASWKSPNGTYKYWYTYDGTELSLYVDASHPGKGSAGVEGTKLTLNDFMKAKEIRSGLKLMVEEPPYGDLFNGTWTKAK